MLRTRNLHFHRETAARSLCPRCVVAQEEELVKNKKLKSYKKKLEAFNGKLQTMTEHNDVPKECGLLRPSAGLYEALNGRVVGLSRLPLC